MIDSVILNIRAVLGSGAIEKHKRDLLDICIWQITEVDGKWNTRFRSEGAQVRENWKHVQHEHVFQRKGLITRLIAGEKVNDVVADAVPCLVTPEEHRRLSAISREQGLEGWFRYVACGIRVFDLLNRCEHEIGAQFLKE